MEAIVKRFDAESIPGQEEFSVGFVENAECKLAVQPGQESMTLIKELNRERGLSVLVVSHDPEMAAFADRIVRLRDGRVEQ